jgi:hypothetical protein
VHIALLVLFMHVQRRILAMYCVEYCVLVYCVL